MFRSSFTVGPTTVNFGAIVNNHEDKAGPLRELTVDIHTATEIDWNNFRQFQNWDLEVVPMPWGNTVEVLVKGGPGSGTLVIPGLNPTTYTAWLVETSRTWTNSITGHSVGKARFILNAN
jgi:hypothetical protein